LAGLDDWAGVCQFLPENWAAAARQAGARRRARGIRDAPTLLRALLVHLADGCSLAETAVRVRAAGWCSVSAVAWLKRVRAAEEWLRWLAERLWRRAATSTNWGGYRVRAVDATTVQEPGSTRTDRRVHYVINLASLQCEHFELTDVRGGETFRRIPVGSGDLILGDRAYGTPPGIAHVRAAGADVWVRAAAHRLPLYGESGLRLPVLQRLRTIRVGQVREWPARVHLEDQVFAGRLVAVKRGRQATRWAQRRLRRQARRKPLTRIFHQPQRHRDTEDCE